MVKRTLFPVTLLFLCVNGLLAQNKFNIGDKVQANANLNVRSSYSTSASLVTTETAGSQGTVASGPQSGSSYTWWYVNWSNGYSGWSVQDGLDKVQASPGSFTLSGYAYCNTTPPPAPAVMLTWTSSAGATSYDIYKNGSYRTTVTSTSFDNNANVLAGQTYSYYVIAKNSSGSTQSNTINVSVPSTVCGGPPGSFSLTGTASCNGTASQITLNWTTSSGATSYDVYRNSTLYYSGVTGTQFINNSDIAPGSNYTYFIQAKNSYGSTNSNTVSVVASNCMPTLALSSLSPSAITTSTAPYDATLSASGDNFNNVDQVTFTWSGSTSGSVTWYKGDANWNNKVTVNSNTSMTLRPRVVETNPTWSGTDSWTATLKDVSGATASQTFTVTYTPPVVLPDLTISTNLSTSAAYTAGQTGVHIYVTVNHSGGNLPSNSTYVLARLYFSTNSSWDTGDQQLWESNGSTPDFPVSYLNTNNSKTVDATVAIPTVNPGTYYIVAYVDPPTQTYPSGFFSESNENNNTSVYPVTVNVPVLVPTITVTSPNGGENWQVGSVHNITATATGNITGVQIDYSTNGGSTWSSVTTGYATTNTSIDFPWTIPNTPSPVCKVRVTASYNGGSVMDMSDGSFTISPNNSGFAKGNRIMAVTDGAAVRDVSLTTVLFNQDGGAHGTITDGPMYATGGIPSYTGNWWKIQWDSEPPSLNGQQGWTAESRISSAPSGGDVSRPDFTSSYYTTANMFWQSGYAPSSTNPPNPQLGSALGNCTWYAHGRLRELGYNTTQLTALHGNASDWDNEASANSIVVDSNPTVGSIAQTDNGAGGLGHVAVVESVNGDGTITVTESSYSTSTSSTWNFLWRHRTISPTWFQNFIHVPKSSQAAAPTITNVTPNPVIGSTTRQVITINGTNFVNKPTLTLTWNVPPLPPTGGYKVPDSEVTFINSTQLQMSIITDTLADTWTVKVTNPDGQSSASYSFAVQLPKGGGTIDLQPLNVTLSSYSVTPGASVTVNWWIRNNGTGTAGTSNSQVRITASGGSNGYGDASNDIGSSEPAGSISAAATISQSETVTIPANLVSGTYYVWVVADNNNSLIQTSKDNDYAVSPPLNILSAIGQNPALTDIDDQVSLLAVQDSIPSIIIAAVISNESPQWIQFDNGTGQVLTGPTGDVGLMQINVTSPADTFSIQQVKTDWKYNLQVGCRILAKKFRNWAVDTPSPYDTYLDTDPGIIENWYYPIAWYNGSGSQAYSYVSNALNSLSSPPSPMSQFFTGIQGVADPQLLTNFPGTIYTSLPYPSDIDLTTADASQLISHGMYTLMLLKMNGQRIHRWDWATSTVSDVTSQITAVQELIDVPSSFSISQNYPNPFNPSTTVSYDIPTPSHVRIVIYDILGREVKTLVDETKTPGSYHMTFDASGLPSGLYFYRLTAGNFVETKKLMLMK